MLFPKMLTQNRCEHLPKLYGTFLFDLSYDGGYRQTGRVGDKHVDMICIGFHDFYLEVASIRNALDDRLDLDVHTRIGKKPFTIFADENHMGLEIILVSVF